jgi:hypothetical protein
VPIGRLPVHTAPEAALVVNKIIGYERSESTEAMVLVSDISDNADFRQLFGNQNITLSQAIKAAKSATDDSDIRRTWILFGDPTMRIR